MRKYVYIESIDTKRAYRVDWNDLHNSFKKNWQLNSNYDISFTLTYSEQFKNVYNIAKEKSRVCYDGQWYTIQQRESQTDENGMQTMQITCSHLIVDYMKNIRIDDPIPTESSPEVSGDNGNSSDADDNANPQPGVVVKRTDEQQTYTLDDRLHKFFDGRNTGVKYELHGNFPQAAVEAKGSFYEWLNDNLKLFSAYWVPDGLTVKIYDLASLKHKTGKQFRYLNNMTNVDVQTDVTNMVNDVWVYGGKMEKDITSVSGGGNGVTEAQNGDWTGAIKNAAAMSGVKASDAQINLLKAQIRLESGGNETIIGGNDGLADGNATGLLQFKPGTFNYYSRPPYTNIMRGFDQLIAFFNIPNCFSQINGYTGWSPHGAPISKATLNTAPADNTWGWPFPSVGEGTFMQAQRFGYDGGYRQNSFHDGLDFGSIDHPGSEVHAVHGGRCIISRAWGNGGINWYCVIQDSTGLNVEYQEAFGSASNITVNVGDTVQTGQVIGYRTTNHLHIGITRHGFPEAFSHAFSNDGTWIDPLATIKNGVAVGGTSGGDTTSLATTTEVYYALVYHFEDKDSIKTYGRYIGAPITVDSIYDMDALKTYAENTVPHNPSTTLTISGFTGVANMGDVVRAVVPEMNLNTDVTLFGVEGNDDDFYQHSAKTLTFQSTGLAMKDINYALLSDIKDISRNANPLDIYGTTGARKEDHWARVRYTDSQMDWLKGITTAGGKENGGKAKS